MVVDGNTRWLSEVRSLIGTALSPVEYVARAPFLASRYVAEAVAGRRALLRRNAALERENQELRSAVLRHDAVWRENTQLRQLFDSEAPERYETRIAELIGMSAEPEEAIIDKGRFDGVDVGRPVVDAAGLFGQVVEATAFTSRILLVTDPSHAVPVYVLRNGVRAIAAGNGDGTLVLRHAAATLDIRAGDELVSSGLGGRFPIGYPVGVVTSTALDPAEAFANIVVAPRATLDRSRHLLVLLEDAPAVAIADTSAPTGTSGEVAATQATATTPQPQGRPD